MLEIAIARSSLDTRPSTLAPRQPTFICGDAQRLPFDDGAFQIVTIGYGLRNLASWETGLQEMKRVAAPAGRILVLEFGKPRCALWRSLYFEDVMPTQDEIFQNVILYAPVEKP